jgi:alcohol dehydrogenase
LLKEKIMTSIMRLQLARNIVFGEGSLELLPDEIGQLSGKKIFLVRDEGLSRTALADTIIAPLKEGGLPYFLYNKVMPEPEAALADEGADLAKKEGCDLIIGVGGGSAMDVAKAVAVLVTNGGNAVDYWGLEKVPGPGLPTIMIPTTAGTGSEVTFTAVFTVRKNRAKGGINSRFLYPDLALLDPDLTVTLPPDMTASTGMDAFIHAIEGFTSVQANPVSDSLAREAITLIGKNIRLAVANGNNGHARREMLMGSLMAGMTLASAGVGACHAMAYPLGAFFNVPHGLANSVLLPHIMRHNLIGTLARYAEVAELLGADTSGFTVREAAEMAIDEVSVLLEDVGMFKRLRELDIPESSIEEMAVAAMGVERPIANNPRGMSKEVAINIYQEAF